MNIKHFIYVAVFFVPMLHGMGLVRVDVRHNHDDILRQLAGIPTSEEELKRLRPTKQEIVASFLQCYPAQQVIIMQNEWQELEIDLLLKKLDRSTTAFGSWGLRTLAQPVAGIARVYGTTNRIKKLHQLYQGDLKIKINALLEQIKQSEEDLLSFFDPKEDLQVASRSLYYEIASPFTDKIDAYLNRSKIALESSIAVAVLRDCASLLLSRGLDGVALEAMTAAYYKQDFSAKRGFYNGLMHPIVLHSPFPSVYADGYDESKDYECYRSGTGGDCYINLQKSWGISKFLAAPLTLLSVGYSDFENFRRVRDDLRHLIFLVKTTNSVQRRMVQLAKFFKSLEELDQLLWEHSEIFEGDHMAHLSSVCKASPKLHELMQLLKTDTFKSESSYFSRGRVLLAHQLMHDLKNEPCFQDIFRTIALFDGYISIIKLYNEHQNKKAQFCFAQFEIDGNPKLDLKGFWTPLMSSEQTVVNNLFCADAKIKLILTGPNGSGKSTIMKAAAHCIFLAQSWGIVPAESASLTIFTGMRTALNPRESLQDNLSTFMAEKARMDAVQNFIKTGTEKDRYFVLLDEPYRGTVAAEAEQRVWLFAKEISSAAHCAVMLATHLEKPVSLEQETSAFTNYHLDLEEQGNDFKRTFRLIPGAALWWFHDAQKRSRFIDQLIAPQNVAVQG